MKFWRELSGFQAVFLQSLNRQTRARARAGAMAAAPEAGGLAVPVAGFSREVSAERRERADSAEGRPAGSAIESTVADAFFFLQKTSGPCASMRKQ